MKKHLLLTIMALAATARVACADVSFAFDDHTDDPTIIGMDGNAGSYMPGDSFTFDITLTANTANGGPMNLTGTSYWFETVMANETYFTITGRDFTTGMSVFNKEIQRPSGPFNPAEAIVPGGNDSDLGAILPLDFDPPPAHQNPVPVDADGESYFIATLSIQINAATPPGTYTIQTTPGNPDNRSIASEQTDPGDPNTGTPPSYAAHPIPVTFYTITVVPEPATWSLVFLGGLAAVGVGIIRARRRH